MLQQIVNNPKQIEISFIKYTETSYDYIWFIFSDFWTQFYLVLLFEFFVWFPQGLQVQELMYHNHKSGNHNHKCTLMTEVCTKH